MPMQQILDEKIAPLLKIDGTLAIAVPGPKKEIIGNNIPAEMFISRVAEDMQTFHGSDW